MRNLSNCPVFIVLQKPQILNENNTHCNEYLYIKLSRDIMQFLMLIQRKNILFNG